MDLKIRILMLVDKIDWKPIYAEKVRKDVALALQGDAEKISNLIKLITSPSGDDLAYSYHLHQAFCLLLCVSLYVAGEDAHRCAEELCTKVENSLL